MYDEVLFSVDSEHAHAIPRVGLSELDLQERSHLQEWILANPGVLGSGVEIVTSEYDRWQTANGHAIQDRLDILGIGTDGRLVVAELKRDIAPHTIHMQAVNYAAMVSRLEPADVAELYAAHRRTHGEEMDAESALTTLTTERLLNEETIRRPRIVLVASEFPASVTASVVWLNEQGVDISLIRFRPYRLEGGQIVVSFTRLYPVPDVEEFTIGRRREQPSQVVGAGAPWDRASLARLSEQGNPTTLALLDLCALNDGASRIGVKEVAEHAQVSEGSVRGQLAGLTMRLKNPKYGFGQNVWPVTIEWLSGGVASYSITPELAELWRDIRQLSLTDSD